MQAPSSGKGTYAGTLDAFYKVGPSITSIFVAFLAVCIDVARVCNWHIITKHTYRLVGQKVSVDSIEVLEPFSLP